MKRPPAGPLRLSTTGNRCADQSVRQFARFGVNPQVSGSAFTTSGHDGRIGAVDGNTIVSSREPRRRIVGCEVLRPLHGSEVQLNNFFALARAM
jgi:hypothetical protein